MKQQNGSLIENQNYFPAKRPPKPEILYHPQATLFQNETKPVELLEELIDQIQRDSFSVTESTKELFRQATLVSLWFACKIVFGYNGPFEKLNADLHLDMCNFYQRVYNEQRSAGFISRGHFKSTIFSIGAPTFCLLRNPNEAISLASAVIDRAEEFLGVISNIFLNNEFFRWLFPEHVPVAKQPKNWNKGEILLPSRDRYLPTASIKAISVGGSTQGIHATRCFFDDLIGDEQLQAGRVSNSDMQRASQWLDSAIKAFPIEEHSPVFLTGTRYAYDDAYEKIMTNCKTAFGFWEELDDDYFPKPSGEWNIWYRMGIENNQITFPEKHTKEQLNRIAIDDPWYFITQIQNNPRKANLSDFADKRPLVCDLINHNNQWTIVIDEEFLPLKETDFILALDPGATESDMKARTSKTSLILFAKDSKRRRFVLALANGRVPITTVYDWLFDMKQRYQPNRTIVELQGPFTILEPLIREQEKLRKVLLGFMSVPATRNKEIRIRAAIEPILNEGLLYVERQIFSDVLNELRRFPLGKPDDILDSISLAENATYVPIDEPDVETFSRADVRKNTGY